MRQINSILGVALITLFAVPAASAATLAFDAASHSAYADGWQNGDNGGSGFQPWQLLSGADPGQLNPIYMMDPHFVDIGSLTANTLSPPSFGLTTDSDPTRRVEAIRDFSTPLKVGQSFEVEIDGSALEGPNGIGNMFQLIGSDGAVRHEVATAAGSFGDNWFATDLLGSTNSQLGAEEAIRYQLRLTGPDRFNLSVSSLSSGFGFATINASLTGTPGTEITGLRFATFGTGSSVDGARELFFNNLRVTGVPEPSSTLALSWLCMLGMVRRRR